MQTGILFPTLWRDALISNYRLIMCVCVCVCVCNIQLYMYIDDTFTSFSPVF